MRTRKRIFNILYKEVDLTLFDKGRVSSVP